MPGSERAQSWGEALRVYRHPRVLVMLFLGFSAGLPFLLIFSTLSFWLREAGISRTEIGFFSWVGITFSIKVLWAPVIDRTPLPVLTRLLGRRRSWMLLGQTGIAAGLIGIAVTEPTAHVLQVAAFAFLVAFSAATQDVSVDAYRIEAVDRGFQGAMAATYQLGYRIALLVAGAGALYLAEFFSWPFAYLVMAGCMLVGFATVLIIREPEVGIDEATRRREQDLSRRLSGKATDHPWSRFVTWFSGAVISPFIDFFARNGRIALAILALIALYRLSDITMGIMANPFYHDLGFSKTEVANVTKVFGLIMTILGAFLGGLLVARFGIARPLLLGAILVAATNLIFAYLATVGHDLELLVVTISADNLAGGLAGSVFIAYLSSLTNTAYTATQYALFSSLFTLPGKLLGGFSGVIVDAQGYVFFFTYAAALGLPAILLVLFVALRRSERLREAS